MVVHWRTTRARRVYYVVVKVCFCRKASYAVYLFISGLKLAPSCLKAFLREIQTEWGSEISLDKPELLCSSEAVGIFTVFSVFDSACCELLPKALSSCLQYCMLVLKHLSKTWLYRRHAEVPGQKRKGNALVRGFILPLVRQLKLFAALLGNGCIERVIFLHVPVVWMIETTLCSPGRERQLWVSNLLLLLESAWPSAMRTGGTTLAQSWKVSLIHLWRKSVPNWSRLLL